MTKTSADKAHARTREDLAEMAMDDGLVILDKRNDKVHQLNSVAREVWDWTRQGLGPDEIRDQLVSRYEITPDTAMRDVQDVLEQFLKLNLLAPVNTG